MSGIYYYDDEVSNVVEYCRCGSVTKTVCSFQQRNNNDLNDFYSIEVIKTLQCLTCNGVSVVLYHGIGNAEEDEIADKNYPPGRRYARMVLFAPKRRYDDSIPWAIADLMNQAEAILASSPRGCFILCRAALEEICSDFDIPRRKQTRNGKTQFVSLAERIKNLVEQKVLDPSLNQIIDGIRELGNESAHGEHYSLRRRLQLSDADALLELVQYVVDRLYVGPERERVAKEKLHLLNEKVLNRPKPGGDN